MQAQLAASEQLGSSSDYQRWLHVYVQTLITLTQANDTSIDFTAANPVSSPLATLALARLHELTSSLLPPLHHFHMDSERVCGLDRCVMLRSLLPALASGRQTQRIAESVLKRVKESEQRKAERDTQQQTQAETDRKDSDMNGAEHLPPLFPPAVSVRSAAATNGFHPSSPHSPSSTWSSSASSYVAGASPCTPSNGVHSGGGSSTVSKHHQLEQRLMGGGAQSVHVGLNGGIPSEGSSNSSPHVVMVD